MLKMLLNTYLLDYLERDGLFYSLIWRLVKIVSFLQVKYILFHPVQNSYLKKHFHHTWGNWGRLSWILYLTQAITALNTCSSLRTFSSSLDIISMSWLAGSNMNSSLSITCLKFGKKKKRTLWSDLIVLIFFFRVVGQNSIPQWSWSSKQYQRTRKV